MAKNKVEVNWRNKESLRFRCTTEAEHLKAFCKRQLKLSLKLTNRKTYVKIESLPQNSTQGVKVTDQETVRVRRTAFTVYFHSYAKRNGATLVGCMPLPNDYPLDMLNLYLHKSITP